MLERLIDNIRIMPGILHWRKRKYDQLFATKNNWNLFRGIYKDFNEAQSHIPETKPIGYNNKPAAKMYRNQMQSVRLVDYPVIYWLNVLLKENSTVLDYGGHIGIRFYCYSKYLSFSDKFFWYVYDLPAVVTEGKKIAEENNVNKLIFTDNLEEIKDFDILLASGSIQYFEEPFYITIKKLGLMPKQIIINDLPLHDKHEFVTINNMGTAYCQYKVFHKQTFIQNMAKDGWQLNDIWESSAKDKFCHIPFHDEYNGSIYYGMYFSRTDFSG